MVTSSPSKQRSVVLTDTAEQSAEHSAQERSQDGSNDASSVAPVAAANRAPADHLSASNRSSQKTSQQKKASAKEETAPGTRGSLRERKKARARKLILDSAQSLIHEVGYSQTKMRDVAAAADMSYQTLYNYFPTKGLILQELLTRDLLKLHRETFNILHGQEHPQNMLRDLAKAYIDAIAPKDRELWKEVCAELLKATSHHSCLLDLLDRQALSKLEGALVEAQSNTQLDPHIETSTLAQVIFSLLDASLMRYLVNERISRAKMLASVSAQLRFCLTPHLR